MWYSDFSRAAPKMKPYSTEFQKIVKAYEQCDTSIRKVAARFDVSKAFAETLKKTKRLVMFNPKKQGGSLKSVLHADNSID